MGAPVEGAGCEDIEVPSEFAGAAETGAFCPVAGGGVAGGFDLHPVAATARITPAKRKDLGR
jgi:hypothetical protein